MDMQWQQVHDNPPENWREKWQHRIELGRADTKEQAEKARNAQPLRDLLANNRLHIPPEKVQIHIHPKDGYVLFLERKTRADWHGNLDEYLTVGDIVDEEMADYFVNELPPVTWRHDIIQMGEPSNHINGHPTFHTLKRTLDFGWTYAGICYKGETETPHVLIVEPHREDSWGRALYRNLASGGIYAVVNGVYHTTTDSGEPDVPIRRVTIKIHQPEIVSPT